AGGLPGASRLVEEALFFDRLGIVHLRHGRAGIKDARRFAIQAAPFVVNGIDTLQIILLADEPVVAIVRQSVGRMKVRVVLEQPAILHVLVGTSDLLSDEPAQVPEKMGIVRVVLLAVLQKLDAATYVVISIVIIVELD